MVISTQDYALQVVFGNKYSTTDANTKIFNALDNIEELRIVQDINRFLPTFRLKMRDTGKYFSSFLPYDDRQSRIRISFGGSNVPDELIHYDFHIYRRFSTYAEAYDVEGALEISNFSRPNKIRGFSGNVSDSITQIASEMGISDVEISQSLYYKNTLLQPRVTNADMLNDLKNSVVGNNGEAGYFCFIISKRVKDRGIRKTLVFKSLNELYLQPAKYTFKDCLNVSAEQKTDGATEIALPILRYKVYDNYKLLDVSGCGRLDYSYFDYDNTEYDDASISIDDYFSLTEFFAIDTALDSYHLSSEHLGRNNVYTRDFKGQSKNNVVKKINNLSKIWITSVGVEDLYPGDIVRLQFFSDSLNVFSQQYHGFWMVERVVHEFSQAFTTKMLLTRNGMNSDQYTNLVKATKRKRS